MGAEGGIRIYDYEILKASIGQEPKLDAGIQYVHELFGKKLITYYQGDNYWFESCFVCGEEDCNNQEHRALIKPAYLTQWEVWT